MVNFLKKTVLIFICLGMLFPKESSAASLTDSVVKVFVKSNRMDYYRPWQSKGMGAAVGSGVVIEGNRILTNAHVVVNHTFVQVKKNADPKKYTAKVEVIGHDCDLAILTVDDPEFFKGSEQLTFGNLPKLQDSVTVIGYPKGGDKISITEGVVSRMEVTPYSLSARKLLTIQIDAAINSGNSGGPVIQDGKIVGIVMQVLPSGQNIGYMIPVPIISHFFDDLEDGTYDGFPLIGIDYSTTENPTLRKYYHIENEKGGVLVNKVLPFSPADGYLQEGDVILEVDDVAVSEDGTFILRNDERLSFAYLITAKQQSESLKLKLKRKEKVEEISFALKGFTTLVPYPYAFEKPQYYIYGGVVFTVLSTELIQSWGKRWWEKAPLDLTYYVVGRGRQNREGRERLVVILSILSDDINAGYEGFNNSIVSTVNGKTFNSFEEFVTLVSAIENEEKYTVIGTEKNGHIILNNENIGAINNDILKRNNIPYGFSNDVADWLKAGN